MYFIDTGADCVVKLFLEPRVLRHTTRKSGPEAARP